VNQNNKQKTDPTEELKASMHKQKVLLVKDIDKTVTKLGQQLIEAESFWKEGVKDTQGKLEELIASFQHWS